MIMKCPFKMAAGIENPVCEYEKCAWFITDISRACAIYLLGRNSFYFS